MGQVQYSTRALGGGRAQPIWTSVTLLRTNLPYDLQASRERYYDYATYLKAAIDARSRTYEIDDSLRMIDIEEEEDLRRTVNATRTNYNNQLKLGRGGKNKAASFTLGASVARTCRACQSCPEGTWTKLRSALLICCGYHRFRFREMHALRSIANDGEPHIVD